MYHVVARVLFGLIAANSLLSRFMPSLISYTFQAMKIIKCPFYLVPFRKKKIFLFLFEGFVIAKYNQKKKQKKNWIFLESIIKKILFFSSHFLFFICF